jgi:tetratricopeptide (TPR) repeat protein
MEFVRGGRWSPPRDLMFRPLYSAAGILPALVLAALSQPAPSSPAEVEQRLLEAQQKNPQGFAPNYQLGEFYASQGDLAKAIPFLEKARLADPSHYVNAHDLALAYFQTGKLDAARKHIQSLLKAKDAAELHNLLGAVEEAAGDYVLAAKEFYRAAEMEPSEQHLLDLGNHLIRHRDYGQALEMLRFGMERHPRSAALRVGTGVALYSLGRYDEAVAALCEAVDLDPADARALSFLGEMRDLSPRLTEEVRQRLAGFVKLYPKNAAAHYYYALSLWQRTDSSGAPAESAQVESLLQETVRLDPRMSQARVQLGRLYEDQGKLPKAIQQYEKALELQPGQEKVHYRLAQLYTRTGQPERAQREMEKFRRLRAQAEPKAQASRPSKE